jgi:hypothetical protein
MFAIIGIPGESGHRYQYFSRAQTAWAWTWVAEHVARAQQSAGRTPVARVVSDREARAMRWSDGQRIYTDTSPYSIRSLPREEK